MIVTRLFIESAQSAIAKFSRLHHLRTQTDPDDGTTVIPGATGQIYEYDLSALAVLFLPPRDENCRAVHSSALRRRGLAAGMVLRQAGDQEYALSFDPGNPEQVAIALELARVHRRGPVRDSDGIPQRLRQGGAA